MHKAIEVSLIICTRNRADQLSRCLESVVKADTDSVACEVILVNNGSVDHTARVMEAFLQRSPIPVVIAHESRPGLGHARNAGLEKASGQLLAFTDDDCYLAPDYFVRAREVFDADTFQYCGGCIRRFDPTDSLYTCNESPDPVQYPPCRCIAPGAIQGANMVFQSRVVDAIGGFDPLFGAGAGFRCEDIDYCARASRAGYTGAHVPDLVVFHHHGRKPGRDIDQHERGNACARGAYYIKHILAAGGLRTRGSFVQNWMGLRLLKERSLRKLYWECQGAIRYLASRNSNTGSQRGAAE